MKQYSRHNRLRFVNKKNANNKEMFKWKNFKCKFMACCKSKCSLNAKDIDGDGVPDIIEVEVGKFNFSTSV